MSATTTIPETVGPGATAAAVSTPTRLVSIDALRGFDMFWILGGDLFMNALGQMSTSPLAQALATQLEHVQWAGFRFYDLIFPLFVFIVGVSLVFSLSKIIQTEGKAAAHRRIIRRFIILFLIALFYSGGVSHHWPDIRLLGVLNRIALCYLFAGLLYCHFTWRGMARICAGLLIGYWALMTFVPFPDVRPVDENGAVISQTLTVTNTAELNFASTNKLRGVFEPGLNLANYIDEKYLPGKKWDKIWDPEGLLSTLPAIATCLLGVFAGLLLQNKQIPERRKVVHLVAWGLSGLAAGWLWNLQFPVIKKIWTSSYVLVAGGYSALLLACFHQITEIWNIRRWATPFVWIGANPITLYLLENIVRFDRVAARLVGGDVKDFFDRKVTYGTGELVIAIVALGIAILIARFLYRRKIFLRL